jgi:hypothetical protein
VIILFSGVIIGFFPLDATKYKLSSPIALYKTKGDDPVTLANGATEYIFLLDE